MKEKMFFDGNQFAFVLLSRFVNNIRKKKLATRVRAAASKNSELRQKPMTRLRWARKHCKIWSNVCEFICEARSLAGVSRIKMCQLYLSSSSSSIVVARQLYFLSRFASFSYASRHPTPEEDVSAWKGWRARFLPMKVMIPARFWAVEKRRFDDMQQTYCEKLHLHT